MIGPVDRRWYDRVSVALIRCTMGVIGPFPHAWSTGKHEACYEAFWADACSTCHSPEGHVRLQRKCPYNGCYALIHRSGSCNHLAVVSRLLMSFELSQSHPLSNLGSSTKRRWWAHAILAWPISMQGNTVLEPHSRWNQSAAPASTATSPQQWRPTHLIQ